MFSRVCARFLSSAQRAKLESLPEWRQLQKRILGLMYSDKQDDAVKLLSEAEQRNEIPADKSVFFRLKLSAHLASTGADGASTTILQGLQPETVVTLSDEQFLAALLRILDSQRLPNPIDTAGGFYERIVAGGFHRKRNRDNLLRVIIAAAFKAEKPFPEIFDLYRKLAAVEPPLTAQESKIRQKLHPGTVWEFIKAANVIKDKARRKKAIKQIDELLTSNASTLQAECLKPLHLLFEGRVIEYVDAIIVNGGVFTGNHIEYLMVVAEAAKEPRILYNLIGYPEFFNKPELLAKVAEKAAIITGKNGDVDGLAALGRRIAELYEESPSVYHLNIFKKAIHRIAHFYKCCNVALPGNLVVIVKKVSY